MSESTATATAEPKPPQDGSGTAPRRKQPNLPAVQVGPSPEPTPLALFAAALEKGLDPDKLGKLLDLHERIEAKRAERDFADAMALCQSEMSLVVRDGDNPQTKSKYASLDAVNPIVKPVYTKHGFALNFAEAECKTPGWKRTVCDVRHSGGHTVQYFIDLPLDGFGAKGQPIGAMNPVQAAISTGSYGVRVLLTRIFNITIANSDKDGQNDFVTKEQADEIDKLLGKLPLPRQQKFMSLFMPGPWTKDANAEVPKLEKFPANRFEEAVKLLKGAVSEEAKKKT